MNPFSYTRAGAVEEQSLSERLKAQSTSAGEPIWLT